MSFERYVERVLEHEGGYINHKNDPGGATKYGISQRSYPHMNIRDLTRAQAIDIYRRDYWQRVRGDALPPVAAFSVLDAAVNHGPGNAARWLQRAVGVADDGIIGPISLLAIKDADPATLALKFNAERLRFYAALSTFQTFGRGWTRRVADNLEFAAEDMQT